MPRSTTHTSKQTSYARCRSLSFASRSYVESPSPPPPPDPIHVLLSPPAARRPFSCGGPFLGGSWPDRTEIPVGGFLLFLLVSLLAPTRKPVLMLVIKTNLPTRFSALLRCCLLLLGTLLAVFSCFFPQNKCVVTLSLDCASKTVP